MRTLNIYSKSSDWRASRLSNFSADRIVIDDEEMASVEGFIQGTKFPEGDPRREAAFQSTGSAAKAFGAKAERKFIWWKGETIKYASDEHRTLIERAIRAKYEQNPGAMMALIATHDLELTHDTGEPDPPNSSLPAHVFCKILTKLRDEFFKSRT